MIKKQMRIFEEYVAELEQFLASLSRNNRIAGKRDRIDAVLDGEARQKLKSAISLENRRTMGAFFTGAELARHATRQLIHGSAPNVVLIDPACGAGDLLLAVGNELPLGISLQKTLEIWNRSLMGFDVHPEFIRATKTRLVLLAISRLARRGKESFQIPPIDRTFPLISQKDFLSHPNEIARASHILINPPYNRFKAPCNCKWGNGKVSAAALFVNACLANASPGTKMVAILPDVLRSGTSYGKWRKEVEACSKDIRVTMHGQFDQWTDIDVFILELTRAKQKGKHSDWWKPSEKAYTGRIDNHFDVHVGPVVPYRDPEEGPSVAYICAKLLPSWTTVQHISERRKYSGTLFTPPFVAVRRTSRPGGIRAVGTLVLGKRKVAVENHLLVLLPRNKSAQKCKELLDVLKSPETNSWLDERIRCRHLTAHALKELPWWRLQS